MLYTVEHLPDVADMPSPKFVFAHIYFGHPPFVFGRQGEPVNRAWSYSWEDAPGIGEEEYIQGYRDQVHYLNGKMEAAITRILAESERPPIIILHYCPAKSRIESAGWGHRVSFRGGRTAARPVKWAFSRKG